MTCGHKPLHRYWLHWRWGTGSQPLASLSPWYLETTLTVCPHTFLQGQLYPQTPAADGEENRGWKYNGVLWDVHFSSLWSDARNQVSVRFKTVHFWQTDKWWIRVGTGSDHCKSYFFTRGKERRTLTTLKPSPLIVLNHYTDKNSLSTYLCELYSTVQSKLYQTNCCIVWQRIQIVFYPKKKKKKVDICIRVQNTHFINTKCLSVKQTHTSVTYW